MGMESGKILDKQITASSEWNAHHAAHQGRLNFQEVKETGVARKSGSWSALRNDQNQWLQVDLLREESVVTSVATQGRHKHPRWGQHNQWVKSYKLQYSNNGDNFTYYKDEKQNSTKVTETRNGGKYIVETQFASYIKLQIYGNWPKG